MRGRGRRKCLDGIAMPNRKRATALFKATLEAQAAALTTLGVRVPGLLAGTLPAGERTRMVSEKAEAMVESAQATGLAAAKLIARPRKLTPASAISGWLALAEAASRPYHKRVKANARRLGTPPGKGSGRV